MTYFSKKNLKDYKVNDRTRDPNLKYSGPIYNSNALQLSSSNSSKGILTTSNFSNTELKDSGKKKSHILKWQSTQLKYKSKKSTDSGSKSTGMKNSSNYSSKRPKSAKGVGTYISSAKTRQTDNTSSLYKYSMHKVSSSSKYTSSSKKGGNTSQMRKAQPIKSITTKTKKDYSSTSYRKSNVSSTHKKYSKSSRGLKKSHSNSRTHEQGSNAGSNSSRLSPGGYNRPGLGTHEVNTKSYNSLMTMLMRKEPDMYKTTMGINVSGMVKSSSNTPGSNSKVPNSSRVYIADTENTYKRKVDPQSFKKSEITLYTVKPGQSKLKKDLEGYLKTSRVNGSRNHFSHTSNVHTQNTYR